MTPANGSPEERLRNLERRMDVFDERTSSIKDSLDRNDSRHAHLMAEVDSVCKEQIRCFSVLQAIEKESTETISEVKRARDESRRAFWVATAIVGALIVLSNAFGKPIIERLFGP